MQWIEYPDEIRTVGELAAFLRKFPEDQAVMFGFDGRVLDPITEERVDDDGSRVLWFSE